jgi:hypothetical protein
MYYVRFYKNQKVNVVTGSIDSVLSLTNMFIDQECQFKIGMVGSPALLPKVFGYSPNKYWLSEEDRFDPFPPRKDPIMVTDVTRSITGDN